MAKEPVFPKRDLTQAAIDTITTRIDSYDQQWDRRIAKLMEGIERMEATANQIAEKVDNIAEFIGKATEEQRATQIRIEQLEQKVDASFDRLSRNIDSLTAAVTATNQAVNTTNQAVNTMNAAMQGWQEIVVQQAKTVDRLIANAVSPVA